jgi:hypothetical protein
MMHRREHHGKPQPHLQSALAQRRENHIRGTGVRLLGGEMMLHKPYAFEAHLLSEAHLREDILE